MNLNFRKAELKRSAGIVYIIVLMLAVLVFAGAGNFNPSGDSNLSVVPYTHANNAT